MSESNIAAWQNWFTQHNRVQLFEQIWEPKVKLNLSEINNRYQGAILSSNERNTLKKSLKLRGVDVYSDDMEKTYDSKKKTFTFSNKNKMRFGTCLAIDYTVNDQTMEITFGNLITAIHSPNREMNAVLQELDKATIMTQISKDNDSVLTDKMLSQFTAAQIFSMLDLAAGNATRCTARLLDYRNRCLPRFSDINEFSLDW